MARSPSSSRPRLTPGDRGPPRHLTVWQWNANGVHSKRATLQHYVNQDPQRSPDVILIQETHSETPFTLPGYRTHTSPPSARAAGKGAAQGVCTLVRKGLTYIEHELSLNSAIEHTAVEIVTGRKKAKASLYIINIYSNPKQYQQRFRTLLHRADHLAQEEAILLCGDFNAPHTAWGYPKTTAKGHSLFDETTEAGYQLLNDPAIHTRHGTSVQRDTNPDLTFYKAPKDRTRATWRNTGETLGSDHCILEVLVQLKDRLPTPRAQQLTDWHQYRRHLDASLPPTI